MTSWPAKTLPAEASVHGYIGVVPRIDKTGLFHAVGFARRTVTARSRLAPAATGSTGTATVKQARSAAATAGHGELKGFGVALTTVVVVADGIVDGVVEMGVAVIEGKTAVVGGEVVPDEMFGTALDEDWPLEPQAVTVNASATVSVAMGVFRCMEAPIRWWMARPCADAVADGSQPAPDVGALVADRLQWDTRPAVPRADADNPAARSRLDGYRRPMSTNDVPTPGIDVRVMEPSEFASVRALSVAAFGDDDGLGELLDALRSSWVWEDELSFVARIGSELVGHVLYTRALLDARPRLVDVLVLGPVGVRPDLQRSGIGARLITASLEVVARRSEPLVFLEGHPTYYPRFGFVPGASLDFVAPSLRIPADAFMVYRLPTYQPWMTGTLVYCDAVWRSDAVGLRDEA